MVLIERGSEASGASVAVEAEGFRFVSDRVLSGKTRTDDVVSSMIRA